MNSLEIVSIWFECDNWSDPFDESDCNMDVIFTLNNSTKWAASFFTYQNILSLSRKNRETGENLNGQYFCSTDMILVEKITKSNVEAVLNDLLQKDDIGVYCMKIEKD